MNNGRGKHLRLEWFWVGKSGAPHVGKSEPFFIGEISLNNKINNSEMKWFTRLLIAKSEDPGDGAGNFFSKILILV